MGLIGEPKMREIFRMTRIAYLPSEGSLLQAGMDMPAKRKRVPRRLRCVFEVRVSNTRRIFTIVSRVGK